MSIDLLLGLCGVAVTIMVIVGMVLIVPSNTIPAYDPERHLDRTDHGSPAQAGVAPPSPRGKG